MIAVNLILVIIIMRIQLEKVVKELSEQRDLAQSRLDDLLRVSGDNQSTKLWVFKVFLFSSVFCKFQRVLVCGYKLIFFLGVHSVRF